MQGVTVTRREDRGGRVETHIWVGDGVLSLDRVGLETERHRQLGKQPATLCPPVALPPGQGLSRDWDFLGTGLSPHGQSFLPERIPTCPQQPRAPGGAERGVLAPSLTGAHRGGWSHHQTQEAGEPQPSRGQAQARTLGSQHGGREGSPLPRVLKRKPQQRMESC